MPVFVPLDRIEDNPFQPRKHYGAAAIEELAESLEREGQIQHPVARLLSGAGKVLDAKNAASFHVYAGDEPMPSKQVAQLAVGHRRARAWRLVWERHAARAGDLVEGDGCPGLAGVPPGTMPVDLQPLSDERMFAKAVEENRHRVDISAVETAEAMLVAQTGFGMTEDEIGRRFGVARSTVAGKLRLLRLPEPVKDLNREGRLSEQKCRQLLRLFSLEADVEAAAVQYDADIDVPNEYWTREDIVAGAVEMESAAEIQESVDEWLAAVRDAAEQARREREPGFFDADPDEHEPAPAESPAESLSAEAARLHRVLDTHAEHVANIQRRHIVEEVRAAVQRLVRQDLADLSQAALRLADAGVSADVAALHDRAAAEIERYRGILDGTVGIEIDGGEAFLSVPRPVVEVAPADPDALTPAGISVEMNRLLEIYFTSDNWRTGSVQPDKAGRDVIERTVRKIEGGLRDTRALVARMVEAGHDANDRGNARFSPAGLVEMFEEDLRTYQPYLQASQNQTEADQAGVAAYTDPVAAALEVGVNVHDTAASGHGLPVPVLDEPHLWSALRPVWPEGHAKAGKQMLSDEIYDVQARYYLPLLDRYETELVSRSNVKEDITRGGRRALQHVANLRCAYALDEAQLRAFVEWAEANLPDTVDGSVQLKNWEGKVETVRLANYGFGVWKNHDPAAKRFDGEDLHAAWSAALVMGERRKVAPVLPMTVIAWRPSPRDYFATSFARLAAAFAYHLFFAAATSAETPANVDQLADVASVATATPTEPAESASAPPKDISKVTATDVVRYSVAMDGGGTEIARFGRVLSTALEHAETATGDPSALARIAEELEAHLKGKELNELCRLTKDTPAGAAAGALVVELMGGVDRIVSMRDAATAASAATAETSSADTTARPGYPARFPRATVEGTGTWETQDRPDAGVRGGDPLTPEDYAAYETALYGRPVTQDYRDELDQAAAHYTNTSVDDARSSLACGFEDRDRASLRRLREVLFHALERGANGLGATKHKLFEQYTRKVDKRLVELETDASKANVDGGAEKESAEPAPEIALRVTCPRCGSGPGTPCRYLSGRTGFRAEGPHPQRGAAAMEEKLSAEPEPNGYVLDAVRTLTNTSVDSARTQLRWAETVPEQAARYRDACRYALTLPDIGKTLRALLESTLKRLEKAGGGALSAEKDGQSAEAPPDVVHPETTLEAPPEPLVDKAPEAPEDLPTPEFTSEQRIEALLAGDLDQVRSMSDATLRDADARAFTDEAPAEVVTAIEAEEGRRAAEFDAPAVEAAVERRVILVGCGKQKAKHTLPAKDLYTGPLFKKHRRNAEQLIALGLVDYWFILSAEHGLIEPDIEIAPYDRSMGDLDVRGESAEWARGIRDAYDALDYMSNSEEIPEGMSFDSGADTFIVYAGASYAEPLRTVFERVEEPYAGLGIGERLARLDVDWNARKQHAGDGSTAAAEIAPEVAGADV